MKLKLRPENDIQVLTISELDSPQNVDVLRAGITKIFRNGKNKIVLELTEAKTVPTELLRELGRLKLLANELSGDIVLSGLDAETKQKVESFAKPPFAITFPTTAKALIFFKELSAPKPPSPPAAKAAAATAPSSAGVAVPAGAPTHVDPAQFKEDLRKREMGDVGALRKEIELLKSENQSLTALLAQKMWDRREPADAAGYKTKIQELETQLAEILSQPPEKKK